MSGPPELRFSLSPAASANPLARSALRFCALALGIRHRLVVGAGQADIHYAEADRGDGSLWLPYWAESYDPSEPHVGITEGSGHRWVPVARREQRPVDLIGGVGRLLALLDESQVAEPNRGAGGVFGVAALPAGRREMLAEPLVDWHVAALLERLERAGLPIAARLPRWPRGARYAVVLTHDVDGAGLHDVRELLRTAVRGVRYRSADVLAGSAAGLAGWLAGRPDPHFRFASWADLERRLGVRSAFFVHARAGGPRHPHDPTYAVNDSDRWKILGELARDGWEIGVHAGISAGKATVHLAGERSRLEAIVGHPVRGLRHHYWRLDWREPTRTFRRQAEAGYLYDTSIAWRDRIGFRAGTSLPYHPFDSLGRLTAVLEIPTTVMDGHLFQHHRWSNDEAAAGVRQMIGVVGRAGGVLNLNWHQETFWNGFGNAGWRTVYEDVVADLAADPHGWVATPGEVAMWWQERAAQLD